MNQVSRFISSRFRIDNLWSLLMGVSIIIVIVSGYFSLTRANSLLDSTKSLAHSHQVLSTINELETKTISLIALDTFINGSEILPDTDHQSIKEAQDAVEKAIDEFIALTKDNPFQIEKAASFKKIILEVSRGTDERSLHANQYRELIGIIREMKTEEQRLIPIRDDQVENARAISEIVLLTTVVVASLLSLSVIGAIGVLQRRKNQIEKEVEVRVAAQKAYQESEQRLAAIANMAPQILWSTTPDGNPDFFSEEWYRYTGMSKETGSGSMWKDHLHSDDYERTIQSWEHSVKTGEPYDVEYRLKRAADGTFRWFTAKATAIKDEKGNVIRWFGLCHDIHDQKIAIREREELLTSERIARMDAERAIRMKDDFVASLSHELRAPLNSILGWSQIIKSNFEKPDMLEKGMEIIEKNARIQAHLISDILDVSRAVSGKLKLELRPVDFKTIVSHATESIMPEFQEKGVSLTSNIQNGIPKNILVDPERVSQIFWNLLSNALKFTLAGGSVHIECGIQNENILISVKDTGQGIQPEFLPIVFERYRQEDTGSKRKYRGLGLGLSIVRHIAMLHEGSVAVKSEGTDKGSEFIVLIPIRLGEVDRPHHLQISDERKRTHPLSGFKILVVDDENESREITGRILSEHGAEIISAHSADNALQAFSEFQPDIILSDIGMPGKDGYALIKELREHYKRPFYAVALTAFAQPSDKEAAIKAGFDRHLVKPLEVVELLKTLSEREAQASAA